MYINLSQKLCYLMQEWFSKLEILNIRDILLLIIKLLYTHFPLWIEKFNYTVIYFN